MTRTDPPDCRSEDQELWALVASGQLDQAEGPCFTVCFWLDTLALVTLCVQGDPSLPASQNRVLSFALAPPLRAEVIWDAHAHAGSEVPQARYPVGYSYMSAYRDTYITLVTSTLRTAGAPRARVIRVIDALTRLKTEKARLQQKYSQHIARRI